MPHIHELIDWTVNAYIVHDSKVLLIDHKSAGTWLPVGGHVELDEDPEEALRREIAEESGLEVELIGGLKPQTKDENVKVLLSPVLMDIHKINNTHRHIGLVYFARARTDQIKLAEMEHNSIRWFTREELADSTFQIRPYIKFCAEQALEKMGTV